MNTNEFKGDLNLVRLALKKKWAQLTDDDLTYAEGTLEEWIQRIQLRTASSRETVEKFFQEFGDRP